VKSSEKIEQLIAEESARWSEQLQRDDGRDMAAFARWSLKSPQHMRHFLMMMALDQELTRLDPERRLTIPSVAEADEASIVALRASAGKVAVIRQRRSRQRWAIAAIAAGVALLGAQLWSAGPREWREFATARGEQRAVELSDGSIMQLNTQSRVRTRFSDGGRDVRLLEGEALFKVAKDPARPFRVHTSDVVIQAVGTQFNVYTQRGGTTKVSVLEGRVRISPDKRLPMASAKKSASVDAGQEARIDRSGHITQKSADISTVAAWRQRRLVFNQNPLSEVVMEFNRYNRAPQLQVADDAIGAQPYSGAFDADDPESLVALLEADPQLELVRQGSDILIRRR
jgi:transmembrane sensor